LYSIVYYIVRIYRRDYYYTSGIYVNDEFIPIESKPDENVKVFGIIFTIIFYIFMFNYYISTILYINELLEEIKDEEKQRNLENGNN